MRQKKKKKKHILCAAAILLFYVLLKKKALSYIVESCIFYGAVPNSFAVLRVTVKNSCNRHAGIIDSECYEVCRRVVASSVIVDMPDLM